MLDFDRSRHEAPSPRRHSTAGAAKVRSLSRMASSPSPFSMRISRSDSRLASTTGPRQPMHGTLKPGHRAPHPRRRPARRTAAPGDQQAVPLEHLALVAHRRRGSERDVAEEQRRHRLHELVLLDGTAHEAEIHLDEIPERPVGVGVEPRPLLAVDGPHQGAPRHAGVHAGDPAERGAASARDEKLRPLADAHERLLLPVAAHGALHQGEIEGRLLVVHGGAAEEIHDLEGTDDPQPLVLAVEDDDLLAPATAQSEDSDSGLHGGLAFKRFPGG